MQQVLFPKVVWFQEGPGVRNTQYTSSGVKLLNVANLVDGRVDISNTERYISEEEAYGRYKHFLVDEGDFIIASSGIKVEYFDKKMGFVTKSQLPLCMNTSTIRFKTLDANVLDIRYFMYFLKTDQFKQQLAREITGSAQLNFGPSHLKKMYLPLIDLSGQRKIVEILDKVSDLIAKRRAQLDKLDLLVKAKFVEMFGDPVSNPKNWPLYPLCDCLIKIENGKSLVCSNEARAGIAPGILKLSAATYGDYRPEENKAMLDASMFVDSAEVHADDLLFTRKNTPELVGMSAYVFETPEKLMMPDLIFRLDTNHRCNKIFLWKLINHDLFRSKIKALASGSAKSMSNISKERLGSLQIIVPPIELQGKFDSFVRQAYAERRKINCGLEKLETLKKALMQKYFE